MVKVKVCGITRLIDAEKALEYGADLLGFNFYPPSPRCLTPETAAAILSRLPEVSCAVALFVNESAERVRGITGDHKPGCHYSYLQLHGEESADYCRGWDLKIIKAFRLKEKAALADMEKFPADFFLLDSWSAGYGGSGAVFPWEWLENVKTERVILSGGLTVANVAQAVRRIAPYGVDVCSGVEARPGIKDHEKLKEFIIAAKSA